MDISFSSLSTFVLGHKAYSPSCPIEDLQTPIEDLEIPTEDFSPVSSPVGDYQSSKIEGLICGGYSPSSPTKDYTPKVPETVYKVLNVKNEPTMDIEAYSPTSTPKINYQDIEIKREIVFKSEPLFSCEISPIYFENENDKTGLEFCKIESVKGESIDDYVD